MRPYRNEKIASTIQKELSKVIERDFEFDALVTVLEVNVSDDLLKTRVKLGIIPYGKGPEIFLALVDREREIRHKILKRMKIKSVPKLKFSIEET